VDPIQRIQYAIDTALAEPSPARAKSALRKVIKECESRWRSTPDEEFFSIAASAYSYIAVMEDFPSERSRNRALAISVCRLGQERNPSSGKLAETYANCAVDWFFDPLSEPHFVGIRSALAKAKSVCQKLLHSESQPARRVGLFFQCASVLRCQSLIHGKDGGLSIARQSLRTSEAAVKEFPESSLASLSLGLSYQAFARWADNEAEYFERMQSAEKFIYLAHSRGLAMATLALARFYRQSDRPDSAIDLFFKYTQSEIRRRVMLSQTYIAGESAVLLLHRDVDPEFLRERLSRIQDLLKESIGAGYGNSRIFIACARISFALGDSIGGTAFLQDITRNGCTDWVKAAEEAQSAIANSNFDILNQGFALGVTDGAVWNSLGTLVYSVFHDNEFAVRLYKTGLVLSPKSAVIHTNIARVYLYSQDRLKYPDARRHLDSARQLADFSFRWWKPLYEKLLIETGANPRTVYDHKATGTGDTHNAIYTEFLKLSPAACALKRQPFGFAQLRTRPLFTSLQNLATQLCSPAATGMRDLRSSRLRKSCHRS